MTSTPLDMQSGAADDTHIVRIVRLETQMDNVTSALISLQRTQEQNHLAMMAQFEAMRTHIDKQIVGVNDKIDKQIAGVHDKIDKEIAGVHDKIDKQIAGVNDKIDKQIAGVNDKIDKQIAGVHDKIDSQVTGVRDKTDQSQWELLKRMDRQFYWLTGLIVTNMLATTGILVRLAGM